MSDQVLNRSTKDEVPPETTYIDKQALRTKKQNRTIKKQNRTIKIQKDHLGVVEHKFKQDLQELNNRYQLSMNRLDNEWRQRMSTLEDKDETAKNTILNQIRSEHADKISNMKETFTTRHNELQQSYDDDMNRLSVALVTSETALEDAVKLVDMDTTKIKRLEKDKLTLQKEVNNATDQIQRTEDVTQQQLSSAKDELLVMKHNQQQAVRHLSKELDLSTSTMEQSVKVIEGLKSDARKMGRDISSLTKQSDHFRTRAKILAQDKEDLKATSHDFKMSADSLRTRLNEMEKMRETYHDEAAKLERVASDRRDRLEQCELGIENMRDKLQREKHRFIAKKGEYEERANKLKAMLLALKECVSAHASKTDIIEHMKRTYAVEQQHSHRMMSELRQMVTERDSYRQKLETEQARAHKAEHILDATRIDLGEKMNHMYDNEKRSYQLLEECQARSAGMLESCKNSEDVTKVVTAQREHIAQLETRIKGLIGETQDDSTLMRKAKRMGDVIRVRDVQLRTLRDKLQLMDQDNMNMRRAMDEFEGIHPDGVRHCRNMEDRNNQTLVLLDHMRKSHHTLQQKHRATVLELQKRQEYFKESEQRTERVATNLHRLDQDRKSIEVNVATCLYPGQKELLIEQLNRVMLQRNALTIKFQESTEFNARAVANIRRLMKSNQDLEVVQQRSAMDISDLQRLAEQSAMLHGELMTTRKEMAKKDQQYEIMGGQLSALVNKVKIVTEREQLLQEKLKYAGTSDEMDKINTRLLLCKENAKSNFLKLEKMTLAAEHMEEVEKISKNKFTITVEALKRQELAEKALKDEHVVRAKLEASLKQCASDRSVDKQEMVARIRSVEKQHTDSIQEHTEMMRQSQDRINALQRDLEALTTGEQNARTRLNMQQYPSDKIEQAKKDGITPGQLRELQYKKVIADLRSELKTSKNKSRTVPLDNVHVHMLNETKAAYNNGRNEKESEIMHTRADTYNKILQTLDTVQKPHTGLEQRLMDIRNKGAKRENDKVMDLIELNSIHEKLDNQNKIVRQLQWDTLEKANEKSKN